MAVLMTYEQIKEAFLLLPCHHFGTGTFVMLYMSVKYLPYTRLATSKHSPHPQRQQAVKERQDRLASKILFPYPLIQCAAFSYLHRQSLHEFLLTGTKFLALWHSSKMRQPSNCGPPHQSMSCCRRVLRALLNFPWNTHIQSKQEQSDENQPRNKENNQPPKQKT